MPTAACRLRGIISNLRESHILPAFVYRWMKDTSATGYLQSSQQPNVRAQDGVKVHLLCGDCEARVNQWETEFARRIFYPLTKGIADCAAYGAWFLLFCVSVSWRALVYYLDNPSFQTSPETFTQPGVERAERAWREFLLGRRLRPDRHEQHFLPLVSIALRGKSPLPPNINRYLLRAPAMDVGGGDGTTYAYSKLGPFIILGFIALPHPKQWLGTKVYAGHGRIRPRDYIMPAQFGGYLCEKAQNMARMNESLSDAQKKKIAAAFRKDMERAARSDSVQALHNDVRLFGRRAFQRNNQT